MEGNVALKFKIEKKLFDDLVSETLKYPLKCPNVEFEASLNSVSIILPGPDGVITIPYSYVNLKKAFGLKNSTVVPEIRSALGHMLVKVLSVASELGDYQYKAGLQSLYGYVNADNSLKAMSEPKQTSVQAELINIVFKTETVWTKADLDPKVYHDVMDTLVEMSGTPKGFSLPGSDLLPHDLEPEEATNDLDVEEGVEIKEPPAATEGVSVAATEEVSDALMKTQTPVDLFEATKMYQPVKSTDKSSRYFVVARLNGLNIAARLKSGGTLSVRAEGYKFSEYKTLLQQAGFSLKASYASQHFHCENELNATRCLAAVLAPLSEYLLTPMPKAKKIVGKGK